MDIPDIELTESVTGEAILPSDTDHEPGEDAAREEAIRKAADEAARRYHKEATASRGLQVADQILRDGFVAGVRWAADAGLLVTPQRDAEVAAKALEGASHFTTEADFRFKSLADARDWLRERAARIRRGEAS